MFYFVTALIVHVTGGASATTVIRMPRGTIRFPIEYIPAEGNETFSSFGTLDFHGTSFRFNSRNYDPRINRGLTSREARGILIGEPPIRIDFQWAEEILRRETGLGGHPLLILPGGRHSEMYRFVQSYLYAPSTDTDDILVLNPPNPAEYALDGLIFYTYMNSFDGTTLLPIQALVRISNEPTAAQMSSVFNRNEFIPLGLSNRNSQEIHIPQNIRPSIIRELYSAGISIEQESGSSQLEIHIADISRLTPVLPSIEILVECTNGQVIQILRIDPVDYVVHTDDPTTFRIFFGDNETPNIIIPPRIFKRTLIHVDLQNIRVGFGDPLVDVQ